MLAFVLIFTLLAACSGNNGGGNAPTATDKPAATEETKADPTKEPEPKEIVTIRTSITEGELSKEQIAEFEAANPGIKIEIEPLDATKLAAQLATNSAPDVIRIVGAFEAPSYVIRGIAMDLTERIESSKVIDMADLAPIVDVYRFDGKTIGQGPLYGLPKDWANDYAVWYNKRAFEAAGVPVPDPAKPLTWQEIMELAKKLTIKDGDTIKQYGLAATEWGRTEPNFNFLLQYALSAGASLSSEDNGTMELDQPAVRDFINLWVDAVKSNVGPNSLNNDQTSGGDLFLSDRAAMLINGYWYGGVIRGHEQAQTHLEDFGMLPTPLAAGGTRVAPTGGATGGIINANTKHPEEAWTFFEWFFAGKPADDRAKTGWGMPAFKSKMALLPNESEFDKNLNAVLQDELNYTQFLPVNPYLSGGGWGVFDKYAQPLYFDKSTIDEAVQGMTKDANIAVKEAMSAVSP
jgi:multiple sugar transport system substrate-binding protein